MEAEKESERVTREEYYLAQIACEAFNNGRPKRFPLDKFLLEFSTRIPRSPQEEATELEDEIAQADRLQGSKNFWMAVAEVGQTQGEK